MPLAKKTATTGSVYDYNKIPGLLPLARQAYRLFLKDYYMWAPVIEGNYMTVGQNDKYILADKAIASRPYVSNPSHLDPTGIFGIPYFYFRNYHFPNGENSLDATYFALLQRIDSLKQDGRPSELDNVKAYLKDRFGEKAANRVHDQIVRSKEYGVFFAVVNDYDATVIMNVRGEELRPSTFTLFRDDDPLYRRFHWNDRMDAATGGPTKDDSPLLLEFHRANHTVDKLFENSGGDKRSGGGWEFNLKDRNNPGLGVQKDTLGNEISFLGFKNSHYNVFPSETNPDGYPTEITAEGAVKTNYAFYVDTAYINRGTGWIKPQYMLAVDTFRVSRRDDPSGCQCVEIPDLTPYTVGRYLYNTSMYAKQLAPEEIRYSITGANSPYHQYSVENYAYDVALPIKTDIVKDYSYTDNKTKWERLAFSWAIHRGDSLIVLKTDRYPIWAPTMDVYKNDTRGIWELLKQRYGDDNGDVDFAKLLATKGRALSTLAGTPKIGVHAVIDLSNNLHKDWVFSFRYVERGSDDFIIESETENRDWTTGAIIRPGHAGWVKWRNDVPVITRADTKDLLAEGERMNIDIPSVQPVNNEKVSTDVTAVAVAGGKGNVTILNAAGKKVVISNLLGQTITNSVLSSDNASIAVPTGIVIVAVEGEKAVKAVVR
jgi:hypothetical protein